MCWLQENKPLNVVLFKREFSISSEMSEIFEVKFHKKWR